MRQLQCLRGRPVGWHDAAKYGASVAGGDVYVRARVVNKWSATVGWTGGGIYTGDSPKHSAGLTGHAKTRRSDGGNNRKADEHGSG